MRSACSASRAFWRDQPVERALRVEHHGVQLAGPRPLDAVRLVGDARLAERVGQPAGGVDRDDAGPPAPFGRREARARRRSSSCRRRPSRSRRAPTARRQGGRSHSCRRSSRVAHGSAAIDCAEAVGQRAELVRADRGAEQVRQAELRQRQLPVEPLELELLQLLAALPERRRGPQVLRRLALGRRRRPAAAAAAAGSAPRWVSTG